MTAPDGRWHPAQYAAGESAACADPRCGETFDVWLDAAGHVLAPGQSCGTQGKPEQETAT
jgi:hypothetical protein